MGFAEGFSTGAQVRQNREVLRMKKQERDQELMKQGYSFDANGNMSVRDNSAAQAEQLQAAEAAQLAKSLQGQLAAQATDQAFEDFGHTGDATYLQSALDNNPLLKQAWGQKGVQLVQNIDFSNDTKLLANAGFESTFYDTPEKQDVIRKNAYKIYNGKEWSIGLANKAVAETGALQRLGNRRGSVLTDNYQQFVSMLSGPKVSPNTAEGHKYEKEIMSAAQKYDLPPNLIAAQLRKESNGNAKAVSPKGAQGLMQLMPDTAKELGVTDPFDPAQNIDAGAKYLRQQLDKYGDVKLALAAYNAGPGNVDKYGGIPPFGETQDYVQTIMTNFDGGESFYGSSADTVANTILNHWRAKANAQQGTTNENVDQNVRNDTRKLDQADRQLNQEDTKIAQKDKELAIKFKTEGTTSTQKDLEAADRISNDLVESFGGEDAFFSSDFKDEKAYRKAIREVTKIEALTGTELSEADKKNITDIRQLIALGDPAKDLTGSETGMIDATLGNMEKYFNDNVGGTEAKSAYNAFRNSVRNALFGSALTEAEIKSFNDAYGTLGQKLGPVLTMFQTSLNQVNAKLNSTANLMNPYSAKVRLGADQKKLQQIQEALQARIDYIKGLQTNGPDGKPINKKDRKPLDDIFGKGAR